jgi:hypothetical protein
MRNLRFNIASLLGVVLFVAVGFAALREADELWESGLLTLTLGVLLVSILLAVHRREARRAFWIGFALFGWGYLGLSLVPSIESRLITTKALGYIDSKVPGRSLGVVRLELRSAEIRSPGDQVQSDTILADRVNLAIKREGVVHLWDAATGRLLGGWTGTTDSRIRIGHSLLALLAGLLGGVLSRRLGRVSGPTDLFEEEAAGG